MITGFGGADRYLAFLTDELLPELLSKYNVDADEIGLAGHSMGGAFCGQTLLAKTTPFSKFIIGTFSMDGWYTPKRWRPINNTTRPLRRKTR